MTPMHQQPRPRCSCSPGKVSIRPLRHLPHSVAAAPISLTQTEGVQTASHHLLDLRSLKGRGQPRRKRPELSRPNPSRLPYQEHAGTHSAEQAHAPQGAARAGSAAFQEPGHIPAPPEHTQPSHAAAQKGWAPLSCRKLRAAFRPATCSRSAASPSRGEPNTSPCVEGKEREQERTQTLRKGRCSALNGTELNPPFDKYAPEGFTEKSTVYSYFRIRHFSPLCRGH